MDLIKSFAEELIQQEELEALLHHKPNPIAYDGFEPSGRMHIAQGVLRALNTNKLTAAGCHFKFWVADWFAMLNHKMGGDLKKIRVVGQYMIEVWKAAGMDMENVDFLWASEEINANADRYWRLVMDISRTFTLDRIVKCGAIMGRNDPSQLHASGIFYPCMQAADVFFLGADICSLGMDQRKVNMLVREYCTAKKIKFKPVIVSHHMLAGLKEGQTKMSKSDPASAIFMEDTEEEVRIKIRRAFCPPGVVEGNPILDYVKHLVFPKYGELLISRVEEHGGDLHYVTYEELELDFVEGTLHPKDLKNAVTQAINLMLEPVRQHFASGEPRQLLQRVKQMMKQQAKVKSL